MVERLSDFSIDQPRVIFGSRAESRGAGRNDHCDIHRVQRLNELLGDYKVAVFLSIGRPGAKPRTESGLSSSCFNIHIDFGSGAVHPGRRADDLTGSQSGDIREDTEQ